MDDATLPTLGGRAGANALHPDLMTPAERLDEVAEILAAGGHRSTPRPGDRERPPPAAPNSPPEATRGPSPPLGRNGMPAVTAARPRDPAEMAADERIRAVAGILAAGLLRLRARRFPSRINSLDENSLDFGAEESVCRAVPRRRGEAR